MRSDRGRTELVEHTACVLCVAWCRAVYCAVVLLLPQAMRIHAVPPDKPPAQRPSQPPHAAASNPHPLTGALPHALGHTQGPPSSAASVTAAPATSCIDSVDGRTRAPAAGDDEEEGEGEDSDDEGSTSGQVGRLSGSGTSPDVKEDSGGAGNETDVEDEDGADADSRSPGSPAPPPVQGPGASHMYPFPSTTHRRASSVEGEVMSSATSSSSLDSDERRRIGEPLHKGARLSVSRRQHQHAVPVPRLRRIGALGISVHSDSDPDDPNVSGLDSSDRRVEPTAVSSTGDTRATDLGISSNELRTSGGGASPHKKARKRRVVADATFRGIVDELAVQSVSSHCHSLLSPPVDPR